MAKRLDEEGISKRLAGLQGWERRGDSVFRGFVFPDFRTALDFVNRVGELAEGMDHHPDIFLHGYKKVDLTLTTHDAGGLTRLDFDLAERIEAAWKDDQS